MKQILFSSLIAALAVITSPAITQAGFTVTVSDTQGHTHTFTSIDNETINGYVNFQYGTAVLRVQINASSNSPGSGGMGQVTNQTIDFLRGGTGSLGAQTLTIVSNSTGFDLGSPSGSVHTAFQSSTLRGSAYGVTNINGVAVAGSGLNLNGSYQSVTSNVSTNFGSSPFSLGNTMVININSTSGSQSNTSLATVQIESTVLTTPAPSALLLAVLGVPALGFIRRWSRKVNPSAELSIAV